jgi:UDP-N-acetylglucosamine 2-epimerase
VHIAYLIGTRPEAIRSARILEILEADRDVRLTLISSGQHFDWNMLPPFIDELSLPPVTIDLQVGRGSPADHVASILAGLARAIRSDSPDALCVFGDTSSTLAGGLAVALLEVPLVHVEAGCRSFDMSMPEEINRRLVDHAAGLLLAVSDVGRQNLLKEAVPGRIEVVGDPQYDVFAREVETLIPTQPSRTSASGWSRSTGPPTSMTGRRSSASSNNWMPRPGRRTSGGSSRSTRERDGCWKRPPTVPSSSQSLCSTGTCSRSSRARRSA